MSEPTFKLSSSSSSSDDKSDATDSVVGDTTKSGVEANIGGSLIS